MKVNLKKKKGLVAVVAVVVVGLTACSTPSSSSQTEARKAENAQQGVASANMIKNQPAPVFTSSVARDVMIAVQEMTATKSATTSFFFQVGMADPTFVCPSIGMPIPNTAQLTNPEQVVGDRDGGYTSIGQMDPNGLYSPSSSSGSYVLCVRENGTLYLQYSEGNVQTLQGTAHWDRDKKMIVSTSNDSLDIELGK